MMAAYSRDQFSAMMRLLRSVPHLSANVEIVIVFSGTAGFSASSGVDLGALQEELDLLHGHLREVYAGSCQR